MWYLRLGLGPHTLQGSFGSQGDTVCLFLLGPVLFVNPSSSLVLLFFMVSKNCVVGALPTGPRVEQKARKPSNCKGAGLV